MPPTLLFLLGMLPAGGAYQPTLCDNLELVAETKGVDFETDILPIFASQGCQNCHGGLANLELDDASAYRELVCVEAVNSALPAGFKLVVPNRPEDSFLFHKVNCDDLDGAGNRMPASSPPLSTSEQRLIFDWINQGAQPFGDLLFTGSFEVGAFCSDT